MLCKCQVIEKENSCWIIYLSDCIDGHQCFGPFNSKYEVDSYLKEYLEPYIQKQIEYFDFEHPETKNLKTKIPDKPYKCKSWDFEDYKILAWRNAGFRSRR